jgi:DNA-directed RNA polymerase subunit RPC12/RpoP
MGVTGQGRTAATPFASKAQGVPPDRAGTLAGGGTIKCGQEEAQDNPQGSRRTQELTDLWRQVFSRLSGRASFCAQVRYYARMGSARTFICLDCGKKVPVEPKELTHAARPRCYSCGSTRIEDEAIINHHEGMKLLRALGLEKESDAYLRRLEAQEIWDMWEPE